MPVSPSISTVESTLAKRSASSTASAIAELAPTISLSLCFDMWPVSRTSSRTMRSSSRIWVTSSKLNTAPTTRLSTTMGSLLASTVRDPNFSTHSPLDSLSTRNPSICSDLRIVEMCRPMACSELIPTMPSAVWLKWVMAPSESTATTALVTEESIALSRSARSVSRHLAFRTDRASASAS